MAINGTWYLLEWFLVMNVSWFLVVRCSYCLKVGGGVCDS